MGCWGVRVLVEIPPLPYFPTSLLPYFPTSLLPHFPTSPHPTPYCAGGLFSGE
ncbi:hypothetical protein [Microcystis aeruginosa]|uniref:hypothetical protein n=1 Tax=Microcystis aeruginosa TaxID=1126 RepID=UPI00130327C0|nr:hypothetical protein [Microcystis aeruginosa]